MTHFLGFFDKMQMAVVWVAARHGCLAGQWRHAESTAWGLSDIMVSEVCI